MSQTYKKEMSVILTTFISRYF